jgi:hypothetical protein
MSHSIPRSVLSSIFVVIPRSPFRVSSLTPFFTDRIDVAAKIKYAEPSNPTVTFSREQLEEWSTKGQWMIGANKNIPLAAVAPDLALTNADAMQIDVEKDIVVGEQLGEGAFATVYLGTMGEEKVAVKRLNMKGKDDIQAKKIFGEFRREVLTMSALHHPCVVNLKAFSLQSPYSIIMEYVPFGSLYGFLKDHRDDPLPWSTRLRIAYDIAAGMAHLHSIDPPLIHKDLKTPNILMSALDETAPAMAKIADFGISGKLYMAMFSAKKARDREVENPTWLAPEIIREEPYSAASDVYPYGIMLWEILTQQHPYEEFNFSFNSDLEDAIKKGRRPTIPADCPAIYKNLLEACWHDDPTKRPSFSQIMHELLPAVIAEIAPDLAMTLQGVQNMHAAMDEERRLAREALRRDREEKRKVQLEEEKRRKEEELAKEVSRQLAERDAFSNGLGESGDDNSIPEHLAFLTKGPMAGVAAAAAGAAKSGGWRHTLHVGPNDRAALSASTFQPPQPAGPSAIALAAGNSPGSTPPVRSASTTSTRTRTSVQVHVSLEMLESSPYNKLTPADLKVLILNRGLNPPNDKEDKDNFVLVLVRDDAMLKGQRARRVSDAEGEAPDLSASMGPSGNGSTTPPPQQPQPPVPAGAGAGAPPKFSLPPIPPPKGGDPSSSPSGLKRPVGRTAAASVAAYGTIRMPSDKKIDASNALASLNLAPMPKAPMAVARSPDVSPAGSPAAPHRDASPGSQHQPSQSLQVESSAGPSVSPRPVPAGAGAPKLSMLNGQQQQAGPLKLPTPVAKMPMLGMAPPTAQGNAFAPLGAPGAGARGRPQSMALPQTNPGAGAPGAFGSGPKAPAPKMPAAAPASSNAPPVNPAAILAPILPDGTPVSGLPISKDGEWSIAGGTAGGSPMTTTWRRCPQFQLQVLQGGPSKVKITLQQPEQPTFPYIGFYIFTAIGDGKKKIDLQNAIVYQPQHFMNKSSVEAILELKEGYYMVMPSIYHANVEGKFRLTVQGDRTRFAPAIDWSGSSEANGEWTAELSGGCMNNPTWKSNPHFKLSIGGNGKVFLTLTPDKRDVGMGFYVFSMSNANEPVAKSVFTMVTVLRELTLPPGDYTVVPTTFQANIPGAFVVGAYADVAVSLTPF